MYGKRKFTCKFCGKEGERRCSPSVSFCGYECRNGYLRSRRDLPGKVPCPICGKEFRPYSSSKTCSMKCKLAKGDLKRERICVYCGEPFRTTRPGNPNRFCSRKCSDLASRKKGKEFDCPGCGKHVVLKPLGSRDQKYCTRQCRIEHMIGPNHPCWRGERRGGRGPNWKDQSSLARNRDGHRCVGCGRMPLHEKLSVDHIVPFRLAKVYAEQEYKDPNDLLNLATLCRSCHAKKTGIESKLLRGDVVGFKSAVKAVIPMDRVLRALTFWGI